MKKAAIKKTSKQKVKTPIYNHMLDVAFTIESPHENWEKIPAQDILLALEKRLNYLKDNPKECYEAFGFCDTYEVD